MKKLLVLSALSLALLACDDDNSTQLQDISTGLVGEWTADTTITYGSTDVAIAMDLTLDDDKTMGLEFEAGMLGNGSAAGTWTVEGTALKIHPESCTTEAVGQMACDLFFGEDMAFTVSNQSEDSWTATYTTSSLPLTLQFQRVAD